MDDNYTPSQQPANQKPARNNKFNLDLDYRIVILVLLAVIAGMIAVWKPWEADPQTDDRTITVSGETKITEDPDEYTFYPSYEFKNTNKEAALKELTAKSDEVTKKLKELGVADNKIKTDSDGYNYGYYFDRDKNESTYSLRLTVIANNKDMAQKVQDYLVSTSPQGQISPQANFSDAKRKELENKARDEATKDARAKADQSAKNLGFKVGKVKEIKDSANDFRIYDNLMSGANALSTGGMEDKAQSLAIQPGQNDLTYSVTVIYYVR